MRIRELERREWALFRELRLRALADSPDAFARRYVDEQAQSDAHWIRLTESVTTPDGQVMLVAEDDGRPIGLCFGLFDKERAKTGHVGGMWVAPTGRGRGAGRALLDGAIDWARSRRLDRLELWVTEGNGPAARLYERAGFVDTGRRDALESNPALSVIQMALNL
ncbi:MAG TPA: GNAT family N-acetyltransferase [Candidatus Bathyarchaeia archaeon]|nr:GNAT family N-acetyltransferase [Candidatus Bathyarchaeia archaeon]